VTHFQDGDGNMSGIFIIIDYMYNVMIINRLSHRCIIHKILYFLSDFFYLLECNAALSFIKKMFLFLLKKS